MDLSSNFYKLKNFLTKDQNKKFNLFIILSVIAMIFEILSISLIVPLINIFVQGNINIHFLNLYYSLNTFVLIFLNLC